MHSHPSWHASESHCRAFVKRAISCTTQSLQSMLGRGAKRSVLRRYGCGQHRKILWLYQQTMKQIQCFIWLMSFMDCPLDHARNHWKKWTTCFHSAAIWPCLMRHHSLPQDYLTSSGSWQVCVRNEKVSPYSANSWTVQQLQHQKSTQ